MDGLSRVGKFVDQSGANEVKKRMGFDTVPYDDHLIDYEKQMSQKSSKWALFGEDFPREEIVFLCQFTILSIVIIISCINLSVINGNESTWTFLIGTCLGALVPGPKINNKKYK